MAERLPADATSEENTLRVNATGRVFTGEYDEKLPGENSNHP